MEYTVRSLGSFSEMKYGKMPNKKMPSDKGKYPIFSGYRVVGYCDECNIGEQQLVVVARGVGGTGDVKLSPGACFLTNLSIAVSVDESVALKKYLYYYFLKNNLRYLDSGSAQSQITIGDLKNVEVPLPSIETQKKVVSILDAIDEKINNNIAINDNLQQQAMSLYAEMFLNGSDINVTSGTLSDIAVITMGQSPSGSSYNEDGVGEVFYQGRAEFGFRFPKRRLFTTEPKRMAEAGDVLLSVRAPVGDLNIAYERCCIGRGLGAIHSKTGHSSFVLYTMFALRSQLDIFNGEGTVFGSINRDALNAIPIDIPPVTEIDQFEVVAHPIDELIRANYEENCRLEAIRDSLLPKLMSGEIDISAVQL